MQSYYGTKMIHAEPKDRQGEAGYEVVYSKGTPDEYISWSPLYAFEAAYHPTTAMLFGHAIEAMKDGMKVARQGWNGKNIWLAIQNPDENSKMGHPYIYMSPVDQKLVPWLASQTDMLANDWQIIGMV